MTNATNQQPNHQTPDFLHAMLATALKRPGWWIVPTFSALLVAVLAGYLGPKNWDATQSFMVREEMIGRLVGPGRFDSLDAMKTSQQVIQETARRPVVLRRVLESVGEFSPSPVDVETLRDSISFQAPSGAELGKTEILAMRIKWDSVDRATRLVTALFEETQKEVRLLRQRKANSMLQEIGASVELARENLAVTSASVREIERNVGGDLSELIALVEPYSGGSDLRRQITTIQGEIRQAQKTEESSHQLIVYLQSAIQNPNQLLATPRELLESQPSLAELKKRLIEAQVARSTVGGKYSVKHPRYVAIANSVSEIRVQINQEIGSALVGLDSQKQLARKQVEMLTDRANDLEQRVIELAAFRFDYGQLVEELAIRNDELKETHREYAKAESILRAAETVDFMEKLDEPQAGLRPLGPSKKTLVMGAAVAGLLIGLGLVVIVTPSPGLVMPVTWQQSATPSDPRSTLQRTVPVTEPPQQRDVVISPALSYVQEKTLPQPVDGNVTTVETVSGVPGFVIPDVEHVPMQGHHVS